MMDMNAKAVGCLRGGEANEILMEYLKSGAALVQSVQPTAAVQQQPQGTGAGEQVKPH